MKKKIFISVGISLLIIASCFILYKVDNYEEIYYTQIDNTKIEKLEKVDTMKYIYTLPCYNSKGKKRNLKFKTTRELKENAYLSLTVKITGVNKWEEVELKDMPIKAQEKLK